MSWDQCLGITWEKAVTEHWLWNSFRQGVDEFHLPPKRQVWAKLSPSFYLRDYLYQSRSEIGLAVYMSSFILLLLIWHSFILIVLLQYLFLVQLKWKALAYTAFYKKSKFISNIMSPQSFSLYLIHTFCIRDILLFCLNTDLNKGLGTQTLLNFYMLSLSILLKSCTDIRKKTFGL